jgi:hypothetical protein
VSTTAWAPIIHVIFCNFVRMHSTLRMSRLGDVGHHCSDRRAGRGAEAPDDHRKRKAAEQISR